LEIKYDSLTYRDPTQEPRKRHVPALSKLETRMYHSIARDLKRSGRGYLKRVWLQKKTRKLATLLVGIGRYKPMSDDLQVSFETKEVPLGKVHDPLR